MVINELHWSTHATYPVLAALQLFPLLVAAVIGMAGERKWSKPLGILAAGVELLLAVDLYRGFDHQQSAMQFAEQFALFGPVAYHAAADGVTVLFVLLAALTGLLVVLYGPVRGLNPHSRFLTVVFAVQAALMSLLVSVDLFWFTLMSVVQLGLIGYLEWRWATSPEADMALTRFLQFMGTGIVLLLAGTIMLGWNYADTHAGQWSFDLMSLYGTPVDSAIQSLVFFLLFYGLAIRTPLFPLHGWMPLMIEHGSVAVAPIFLLGVKVGVYGMLRFLLPLLPEAVGQWYPYVVAFAMAGIFYAALLAMLQVNMRRLLAFAVVSHTSILVIGMFSINHLAFQGSVLLSVNFGLAITGLFFMAGLVYKRTRTLLLPRLGGLFDHIPFIGVTFLLAGLSIVGMPGTPGFDAAHLILEAAMHRFGALVTIAAALGNVIAAGFLLWAFQRAFLSPLPEGERARAITPASGMELLIAGTLVLVLVIAGFYSEPWLALIEHSLEGLDALYGDHVERIMVE